MSLLDGECKKESEVLSLSTSGVYSSSVSAASDSLMSQPLYCVDPLHNFYERSPAEHYSHSSSTVEGVSEFEPVLSSGIQEWEQLSAVSGDGRSNCDQSLMADDDNDDLLNRDKALLEMDRGLALDTGKEWMINAQSLAVNSSLHMSEDSVGDVSSVITDSDIDSSTLSSRICASEISATEVESNALQVTILEPKRILHGRSASEGGIFGSSQCFQNLPQHVCVHRRHEQGGVIWQFCIHCSNLFFTLLHKQHVA